MIIYQSTKGGFLDDVLSNDIQERISNELLTKTGKRVAESEIRSWKESMRFMGAILKDRGIPEDAGVAIEYHIPQSSKRIDFILTGRNEDETDQAILIELKQWESAQVTEKDGVVKTRFKSGEAETTHPSYQAWSYSVLLYSFNQAVYEDRVSITPCAYLHNYKDKGGVTDEFYKEYIDHAPLFLSGEAEADKLKDFIKKYIKHGDNAEVLFKIENGKIRPSKSLADSLSKMLEGNPEFTLIDEQKLVYEEALKLAAQSSDKQKHVLIVEGGPGTGKSVLAIMLMVELINRGLVSKYVTKNAAPRAVYEAKLTGKLRKTEISNLFTGSGSFTESNKDDFDALIVDEAHRLNEKSGLYRNMGENQIKEIIFASKFSVFFIDENQQVTLQDIGHKTEIEMRAREFGAKIHRMELASQFRCSGSDGYLAWLDNALQVRETANTTLEGIDYDFRIVDSPNELRDLIFEKNKINNKARLVAGYCWDWVSKKSPKEMDVVIPEHDFAMQWNLATDGSLWVMAPESVNQIGCIHTCQGLEVDYIGVIIGSDLVVRDGEIVTDPSKRSKHDSSIKGYKKFLKDNPEETKKKIDAIIKNTYRTLMTRGMKGCYVYCTDSKTKEYFKKRLRSII